MRYLQDASEGWRVHGAGHIIDNLERFLRYVDDLNLVVTGRLCRGLVNLRDHFYETEEDSTLSSSDAEELTGAIREIRYTLLAEAEGNVAFIVRDKRIDINKLLHSMDELFAPGVFQQLSEIAQEDFYDAGRCIAFELPTSAAFHLMRGTESVFRDFYKSWVKRDRVKPLVWGAMVDHLRSRRASPSKELLDNLDNIRHNFRNPTQHPDKLYDIDEAQDLFGLCIDVVNRMCKTMK